MNLHSFKEQFNQKSPYIHFNNSGQAPIPLVYKNKMHEWLDKFYSEAAWAAVDGWNQVENSRATLAQFIGAETSEVSFFQTTASALSQAAFSIPLKAGDEILTWDQEYPSNFYPWKVAAERVGAQVIQLTSNTSETPVETILNAITANTKIIAISWIQFGCGAETDMLKLSRALNGQSIWLVADVIQGLGVHPFNFKTSGFDIICGGSHKWLCSGYGVGFMVTKKEKLESLNPIEYGAMTFGTPDTPKSFSIKPKTSAVKFEPGSKSMLEIIAMTETLKLLDALGMQEISDEAQRLTHKLRTGVNELGYKIQSPHSGCILNFTAAHDEKIKNVIQVLNQNKVSHAVRAGGIRLSLHAFNYDAEVEKVINLIPRVL